MSAGGAMNNQNPRRRKRPEKGPGSKFLGEKRRREQETSYLEELAELISASLSNPESLNMMPGKRAFLQETVNKIKRLRLQQHQDLEQGSEVQHSHVSSSKPGMLSSDSLGSVLLEALDGFLFVVNSSGEIEFVTENVKMYLNFKQEDLIGSSIYSLIHVGDHNQFINCLLPTSTSVGMWSQDSGSQGSRNRSFTCRMLTKPADEEDTAQEQHYENLKCSAILKPKEDGQSSNSTESDPPSHLFCIASRAVMEESGGGSSGAMMLGSGEEFTTGLDLTATITSVDLSHLKPPHYSKEELVGQIIYKFCHASDRAELKKHFDEALEKGTSSSLMFRFQIYTDTWVYVQTMSRVSRSHHTVKPDCLVSVHSVLRDNTSSGPNPMKSATISGMASTSSSSSSANRILEALSNISNNSGSKSLPNLDINMLKSLVLKQQHMQQQQQQQQQGMGFNGNKASTSGIGNPSSTPSANAQDVLDSLKRSSLSNMLQDTSTRNRNGAMETSSVYPVSYNSSSSSSSSSNSSSNSDRHPVPEKVQRMERSPSDSNIASSTEHSDRRMLNEQSDDGDIFLPEHQNHKKGRFPDKSRSKGVSGEGLGSSQVNRDSPTRSPDTNEGEKENSTLSKNTLLQKLLQDDIEEDKTEDGSSSPSNSPMCTEHKGTSDDEKLDEKAFSKLLKSDSSSSDKPANPPEDSSEEVEGNSESVHDGDSKKRMHRKSIERENIILSKLLDGDTQSMFGSGKLPREQPGFVCSNVVSTTTALQKCDNDPEKAASSKNDKNTESSGSNGAGGNNKKQKNYLLQQLLMEDLPPPEKVRSESESTSQESTTSPTVTTTKPGMSGAQPPNAEENSVDSFGNDEEGMMQQILQAAGNLPEEGDTSQPNMIMDFLTELDSVPDPTQDPALMHHLLNTPDSSGPTPSRYPPHSSSSVGGPPTSQSNQYKVPMGPEALPGPGPHQRPDSSAGGGMNNPSLMGQGVGHEPSNTMHSRKSPGMNSQHRPPVKRGNSRDPYNGGSGGMHPNSSSFGRFGSPQQECFSMDGMQNVMPPNQTAPMQTSMSQLQLSGNNQQQTMYDQDHMQDLNLPGNNGDEAGLSEEDVNLLQQLEQVLNSSNFSLPELENNFDTDHRTSMNGLNTMDHQPDNSNMLQNMLSTSSQAPHTPPTGSYPTPSSSMGLQQQQQQQQQQRSRQQQQQQKQPPLPPQQHAMMGMGGAAGSGRMGQGGMPDMQMMGAGMNGSTGPGQPRFPQQGQPQQMHPQQQQPGTQPLQYNQMNSMQQQLQHQLQQQQQQQQHGPLPPHSMTLQPQQPPPQMPSVPNKPQQGVPMSSAPGPGGFVRPHKQLRHTLLMRSRMREQQQQQQQQQQLQQQQQQQQHQQQHRQWQLQQQRQQQMMRQQQMNAAAVAANQQQMGAGQQPQQQQMGPGSMPVGAGSPVMNPMQQNQRLMQQQKNLMMLQQQQQQQTFTGPQVEGGVFPPLDTQAFQEKLSDVLNPTAGVLAPNVSIQKSPGPYGPQMSGTGNRPMPGGNQMMGGDGRQQMGMNQPFPGQAGSNRGGPDFMFSNQMMQQGRVSQGGGGGGGYQGGMGHGGGSGGQNVFNFQDFNSPGGMAGGGNPNHMMSNSGMMGPSQHQQGMGMNPNMPGGQHSININPNIPRPNLAAVGSPRQQTPTLTRSMSLPTTNMVSGGGGGGGNAVGPANRHNQYNLQQQQQQQQQQPGFPGPSFRGNQIGGSGGMPSHFPGNSMNMQPGQMASNASMFSSPSTGTQMRWSGPNGGGMQRGPMPPHQGQMFAGSSGGGGMPPQSSEMLRGMANAGAGGSTQELQNMMNRRLKRGDSLPANPSMMPTPPKYPLQGTLNSSIPVPANLAGQNSMNLAQQSSGDATNTTNSYLAPSSSSNGGNANNKNRSTPGTNPSNLDMLNSLSMEMFEPDFTKQDGQNPIASSTTNPTSQPDSTSTSTSRNNNNNPGADPLKSYVEMQSNEEAKLRYQELYNLSGAQTAPDACTRVKNLFRNQLTGQSLPPGANGRGVGGGQGMGGQQMQQQQQQQGGGGMVPPPPQQQHNSQQQFGNEDQNQQEGPDGDGKSNNSLLQKLLLE